MNALHLELVMALIFGLVQVIFALVLHEMRESKKAQGERIGALERAAERLAEKITRIEVHTDQHQVLLDGVSASLRGIEHEVKIIGQKLSAATGIQSSPSTAAMPALRVPRPSRPGDDR